MYAIYANIYHQYTPNVGIYTSTMDPSWVSDKNIIKQPESAAERHLKQDADVDVDPTRTTEITTTWSYMAMGIEQRFFRDTGMDPKPVGTPKWGGSY